MSSTTATRPISLTEAIIKLWGEARDPGWIASKLNITDANGDPDTERVLCIIEDPTNYPEGRRS